MTREQKLALILGFALVLLVGVAVSDHFSQARLARLETGLADISDQRNAIAVTLPPMGGESTRPIRTVAAAPEKKRTPSSVNSAGPVGKGLDKPRSLNAIDWIDRFHNQLSELPRAAETSPVVEKRPRAKKQSTSRAASRWRSVREGDTLWSIAREQYGDGSLAGKLAAFNGASASDPDLLRVGVRLRIPPVHVLTGKPAPSRPMASSPKASKPKTSKPAPTRQAKAATPATRRYTIKPGDTLGEIAMKQLGTIKRIGEIIALNPKALANPDIVPVGTTIRLPAK